MPSLGTVPNLILPACLPGYSYGLASHKRAFGGLPNFIFIFQNLFSQIVTQNN